MKPLFNIVFAFIVGFFSLAFAEQPQEIKVPQRIVKKKGKGKGNIPYFAKFF